MVRIAHPTRDRNKHGHFRTYRQILFAFANDAIAGAGCSVAGHVRGAGDAARGRTADQCDDGERADRLSWRIRQGCGADRGDARRTGVVADRRRGSYLLGIATGHGYHHRAVQGRRGACALAGQIVRCGEFSCRLVAAHTGSRPAYHQGQRHRRCSGGGADIVARTGSGRQPGIDTRGSCHRSGVEALGATQRMVRVLLDPESLNAFQLSMQDVRAALQSANVSQNAGSLVQDNREVLVQTGSYLSNASEVRQLVISVSDGKLANAKPIFLRDIAEVQDGADQPDKYVWMGTGPAAQDKQIKANGEFTAVTLAITKKPGANAVDVARQLLARVDELKGSVIPADVQFSITRNYGETANDKALKLIQKLL